MFYLGIYLKNDFCRLRYADCGMIFQHALILTIKMVKKGFFMTLNQMFDFTPVYIYIVTAVQLFIGFSLSFAIGQILPLLYSRIYVLPF